MPGPVGHVSSDDALDRPIVRTAGRMHGSTSDSARKSFVKADAASTASLRLMMGLNGLELAILLLWVVGIGVILHTGFRAGFSVRTWAALAVAVLVPVAGSLFAIAYAVFAAAERKAGHKQPSPQ